MNTVLINSESRETIGSHNPTHTFYSVDKPRFSLTLAGPTILAADATHIPITAKLHYHAEPSTTEQALVVFKAGAAPLASKNGDSPFTFTLYASSECRYEDIVRWRISCILARPERLPGGKFKPRSPTIAISEANGFQELAPGTSRSVELSLKLSYWLCDMKPGDQYTLAFIGDLEAFPYWRYGSLEASVTSECITALE